MARPFISGKSFDPVTSGRDRGLGYKYFLACAFKIPLPPVRKEEPPLEDADLRNPEADEVVHVLELVADEEEVAGLHAVTHRVRQKGPEEPEPVGELGRVEESEDKFPDIEALMEGPPLRYLPLQLHLPNYQRI